MNTKTLLDLPRGAAKLVAALHGLEAQGYDAAEYATLAALLDQHEGHVKASARAAKDLGYVAISNGGGRGKKSTVALTDAGRALVVSVPAASVAGE